MKKLSSELIAYLGTNIAVELARDKTAEEINVIKNIASQVSATLGTILSQQICLKNFYHSHTKK